MWQAAQHSKATLCPMSKKIRKETPPPPKKKPAQWDMSASMLQTGCKVSTQLVTFLITMKKKKNHNLLTTNPAHNRQL